MKITRLPTILLAVALSLPASADMLIDGQVSAPRQWSAADLKAQSPQLVMPGDKRGGRYVHDVVHIEVR